MQPNQPGNYWQPPAEDNDAPAGDQPTRPQGPLVTMRADVPAVATTRPTTPS